MRLKSINSGFFVVPLLCLIGLATMSGCSEDRIPKPAGSYQIGFVSAIITDPGRTEPNAADPRSRREFLAKVWYPSDDVSGRKLVPVASPALKKALAKQLGFPEFLQGDSLSYSAAGAPISQAREHWPVLVFAHGFGSFDTQNLTQMEELASRGYAVVSLGFPYESALVEFPDGRKIEQAVTGRMAEVKAAMKDPNAAGRRLAALYKALQDSSDQAGRENALAALREDPLNRAMMPLMAERFADTVFLLEHLELLNALPELTGRLDRERIGIFGHSFGGGLAAEIAMRRPDLVRAAADMDCLFWDAESSGKNRLTVPTLFMYATDPKAGSVSLPTDRMNDYYFLLSEAPVWSVSYQGTGHHNFSDLGYVDFLKFNGMNGPAEGYATGLSIQEHLSAFFDRFVRGDQIVPDFGGKGFRVESRN